MEARTRWDKVGIETPPPLVLLPPVADKLAGDWMRGFRRNHRTWSAVTCHCCSRATIRRQPPNASTSYWSYDRQSVSQPRTCAMLDALLGDVPWTPRGQSEKAATVAALQIFAVFARTCVVVIRIGSAETGFDSCGFVVAEIVQCLLSASVFVGLVSGCMDPAQWVATKTPREWRGGKGEREAWINVPRRSRRARTTPGNPVCPPPAARVCHRVARR